MAKVLWAADRRVTKDDGTPAASGTLTIRLADTSTTATAYTDRALSTEQSVFTIGSDGYLQNRPTIYGADDVGYDAYVQSTGVNGSVAWTIPDLSIADSSASSVTNSAAAFKNLIPNGAFDVWGSDTSWSNISGDNNGVETAKGWFFAQPSAASNEVSRQTASRTGARYGIRFGRASSASSTNKLRLWGMLPTEAAIRARGQTITISFNAHKGANFSGGSLAVKIATGTAAGEDGDNIESGGFTGHATPLNTAQTLDTATARYEFQTSIGASVSELGFQFSYTPSGTAGANDWVQVEDVQIEIASAATAFVSTPEPVSFLIEEATTYGRQLLSLSALSGAVSLSGTTLSVSAANILTQLLTVDGASSGLDADLLDGANLSTDGTFAGNSDALIPTQKAVKTYADALLAANDAMVFKGVIDCSANPNYPAANRGDTYRVSVAGKIGGASGVNVENGDLLVCMTDSTASGNHATVGAQWAIAQTNVDGAYFAGGTDVAVADGGTGASDAAGARTNLGLVIGTNVQAYSANLVTYAGIAPSANVQSVLGAADYAAIRTLLSLGTAALVADSGLVHIAGTETISGNKTFSGTTLFQSANVPVWFVETDASANAGKWLFNASGDVFGIYAVNDAQGVFNVIAYISRSGATPTAFNFGSGVAVQSNSVAMKVAGKEAIPIPASAMIANTTNGPSSGTTETTTNKVMYRTLDFDTTTQEGAQFEIIMPKGWNESTVTFQPVWTAASGSGGVVWELRAQAQSDDDAIDGSWGTGQTSTDTLLAAGDRHIGPESSAITIGGSPAEGDVVVFQIRRNVSDGSDTLGVDAKLMGIRLFVTTNAANDA